MNEICSVLQVTHLTAVQTTRAELLISLDDLNNRFANLVFTRLNLVVAIRAENRLNPPFKSVF